LHRCHHRAVIITPVIAYIAANVAAHNVAITLAYITPVVVATNGSIIVAYVAPIIADPL
jgi:hypothetical protein